MKTLAAAKQTVEAQLAELTGGEADPKQVATLKASQKAQDKEQKAAAKKQKKLQNDLTKLEDKKIAQLTSNGFTGNIFSTFATRDLCQIMLADWLCLCVSAMRAFVSIFLSCANEFSEYPKIIMAIRRVPIFFKAVTATTNL